MALLLGTPKHNTLPPAGKVSWLQVAADDVNQSLVSKVVVDLTTVEVIRSEELNELIRLNARLRQQGRSLSIENVQDQVWQVFMLTRLDRLFRISRIEPPSDPAAPQS
jgi:anti-anti-sigma factor